jgi:hypothetical protein
MWRSSVGVIAVVISCGVAQGQAPTELSDCGPGYCYEYLPCCAILDCSLTVEWESWGGARSWGPLTYVGPIQISVEARPLPSAGRQLPLYFLVRNDPGAAQCEYRTGNLIWETQGTLRCDSLWVTSQPIILYNIPVGTEYWIQTLALNEFGPIPESSADDAFSAFRRCIRVQPAPVGVVPTSWSRIKTLYR